MFASRRVLILASLTALGLPAAASAATRFAAPAGSGTACSAAAPCALTDAVGGAASGDEIVITPGEYVGAFSLNGALKTLNIHGVFGQPRPVITSSVGSGVSTLFLPAASSLRHVTVTALQPSAGSVVQALGASIVIDGVDLRGAQGGLIVDEANGTRVSNSFLVATGPGNAAAVGNSANVRFTHTTLIAPSQPALSVLTAGGAPLATNVIVENSIVRGSSDVVTSQVAGTAAQVSIAYSAYRPAATTGNVAVGPEPLAADPIFVNAAAGDYHQAPSSPTVDKGNVTTIATDFDGQPRSIGLGPDIGADEVATAAAVVTDPATAITQTGATLGGSVNPNGLSTTYRFEYGTTTAYGLATGDTFVGGDATPHPAAAILTGLAPGTRYHARLVATNALGSSPGNDVTFTTAAQPDVTPPVLGKLRLAKPRIAPGTGTVVRFSLSEQASVVLTVERLTPGRSSAGRCVPTAKTGARCQKTTRVARIAKALGAGATARIAIPARPGGTRLTPGSYRITVVATDAAGNASRPRTLPLVVRAG